MNTYDQLLPEETSFPPSPPIPVEAGTIPAPPPLPVPSSGEQLQTRLVEVEQAYRMPSLIFAELTAVGFVIARIATMKKKDGFSFELPEQSPTTWVIVALIAFFVVLSIWEMKLASRLGWSKAAIVALAFPPWSVVAWFILRDQAKRFLRKYGVQV